MKIIEIRALQGANFFSQKPVVRMLLDLEEHRDSLTHQVAGFSDRLVELIHSLAEHKCAPGVPGGFLEMVRQGTRLCHVVEHIALKLQ